MPPYRRQPNESALLAEYSVAQSILSGLDTRVWSVYSVVTTVAVAALVFTTQADDVTLAVLVGAGAVLNLVGWWLMALRWWSYGDVVLSRMREIEVDAGLRLTRHLWWSSSSLTPAQIEELSEADRKSYQSVREAHAARKFPTFSQRRGALVSVLGLGLAHGGAVIVALASSG